MSYWHVKRVPDEDHKYFTETGPFFASLASHLILPDFGIQYNTCAIFHLLHHGACSYL